MIAATPPGLAALPRSSAPNFTLYRLVRHLRPQRVLEIGTQTGASAIAMGLACRDNGVEADITCVDPFYPTGDNEGGASLAAWYANVHASGLKSGIQLLLTTSQAILPELDRRFDLAFVDGSHLYEDVRADMLMSLALLRPGGYLIAHDYIIYESVRRACDAVIAEYGLPHAVNSIQMNQRGERCGWIVARRPIHLEVPIQEPVRERPPQRPEPSAFQRLKSRLPPGFRGMIRSLLGRPRA